jgi:Flp pilus assembly protein TadG
MHRHAFRRATNHRPGVATVEMAFVLPVLLAFIFAGLEFSRVNMVRNLIENAAYDGARRGILPGATASDCEQAANDLLQLLNLDQATVTVMPAVIDEDTPQVTVTVDYPLSLTNGFVTPQFYLGKTLASEISLRREVE